jgi:protein-disulfide isomerase
MTWWIALGLAAAMSPGPARAAEPPVLGPAGAPVTVEVYCDFLCPTCAQSRPALRRLLQAHPGQVRFVLRDFPVHSLSGQVAEAAACAGDQGKFWEMRDYLYDRQRTLSEAAVRQEARRLGLDPRFDICLASRVQAAGWKRDHARGRALGVSGTPSFVIGNRLLEGFDEAALERAIRKELGR